MRNHNNICLNLSTILHQYSTILKIEPKFETIIRINTPHLLTTYRLFQRKRVMIGRRLDWMLTKNSAEYLLRMFILFLFLFLRLYQFDWSCFLGAHI